MTGRIRTLILITLNRTSKATSKLMTPNGRSKTPSLINLVKSCCFKINCLKKVILNFKFHSNPPILIRIVGMLILRCILSAKKKAKSLVIQRLTSILPMGMISRIFWNDFPIPESILPTKNSNTWAGQKTSLVF